MFQDIHLSSILHFPAKEGGLDKGAGGGHDEYGHKLFVI